jgi:hypothetical protein
MFSIPSVKKIIVVSTSCLFFIGLLIFLVDQDLGTGVLICGVILQLNLFLWIFLVRKMILILVESSDLPEPLEDDEDPNVEHEENIKSGSSPLFAIFFFLLKISLLSIVLLISIYWFSTASIIISNTIIVLSLLFSSIQVNLSTQTEK